MKIHFVVAFIIDLQHDMYEELTQRENNEFTICREIITNLGYSMIYAQSYFDTNSELQYIGRAAFVLSNKINEQRLQEFNGYMKRKQAKSNINLKEITDEICTHEERTPEKSIGTS